MGLPLLKIWILSSLSLISYGCFGQSAAEYEKTYWKDYQKALSFWQDQETLTRRILKDYPVDISLLIPAVFPETVRYSSFKNAIEMASLKLLYVQFGSAYANFSIGILQMKPSFAEDVEKYVLEKKWEKFSRLHQYPNDNAAEVRKARVQRLDDFEWQLHYLAAFYALIEDKYHPQGTPAEKLAFIAAAYNRGFSHSKSEIKAWIAKKAFPDGLHSQKTQFAYTDIALYFAKKHFSNIFP